MENPVSKILIVGGGFAGIRTALELSRSKAAKKVKITLLSDRPHFEYCPALYRLATGSSAFEVCIPLAEIFEGTNIEVVTDTAVSLDRERKVVIGGSTHEYAYDKIILTVGAETNYFGIPGLKEYAHGMKSVKQACLLRNGIEDALLKCKEDTDKTMQVCDAHFIVIGGGATGIELAGELAPYARERAKALGVDPMLVTVDLIEASPRVMPLMPEWVSSRIDKNLRRSGVNIFTNRAVMKQEVEETFLKDMQMKAKTVIWTSGVKANELYGKFGMPLDPRGRVSVDEYMHPKTAEGVIFDDIYIGGDGASTKSSGFAQTAYYDGVYIARAISNSMRGAAVKKYTPPTLSFAMPAGRKWAAVVISNIGIFGRLGWWIRRAADFRALWAILPFNKVMKAWKSGEHLNDECLVCKAYDK